MWDVGNDPSGAIHASIEDTAKWLRLQLLKGSFGGKRLLCPETFDRMHTPQVSIPAEAMQDLGPGSGHFWAYGFGWYLTDYRGHKAVMHGGGFTSYIGLLPEEELGVTVLANLPSQFRQALIFRIFDLYLGAPERDWSKELLEKAKIQRERRRVQQEKAVAERPPGGRPPIPLAGYAGTYSHRAYGDITVTQENDGLVLRFARGQVGDLEYWQDDKFRVRWRGPDHYRGFVTFKRSGEQAQEVTLPYPEATFKRVQGRIESPTRVLADDVESYIKSEMEKRRIPGLALAVIKDGKVVKQMGFGLANVELNVPVTPDTVFDLASITKQFTAAAVLLLAEEGKLRLDDKIGLYLPNAPATWNAITVRHLLTHTSGLKNYYWPQREGTWLFDPKAAVTYDGIKQSSLSFAPGEAWSYSNQGYFLLAMIIEKASGMRYGDFLKERILIPLRMNATRMLDQREIVPNRAAGYTIRDGKLAHIRRSSQIDPGGPEGLLSTVEDLARWDAALYSESLLKKASLNQMWAPAALNNGLTHAYGCGWFLDEFRGHRIVWHTGGTGTNILRLPEHRLTVIVLSNMGDTSESDPWSLAWAVAGMYLPELWLSALPEQSDPDPQRTQRMNATLSHIARGEMDTPLLTREAAAGLPPWIRWGMGTWLKDTRSFTFIACDDMQDRGWARYGVPVKEVCYYKLVTPLATPYFWKFYLTADGKVADISVHAE